MIGRATKLFATSVFSVCLVLTASVAGAGYYYESVTDGRSPGQKKGTYQKVKAWVEGDNARIEFASGDKKGLFADGN